MKILYLTKKYPNVIGGDATVVSILEKYQIVYGNEMFILAHNCNELKYSPKLSIFGWQLKSWELDRINFKRILFLLILVSYAFIYLNKIKPDIVHSHSADLGFAISFACRLYKIPLMNTCHGVTFPDKQYPPFKRWLEKFFLKYSGFKKIITVDENSLSAFKKEKINNVVYIPNGVDLKGFSLKKRKSKKSLIFLFVGRLENQKGLDYLIKATEILKKRNLKFQVNLVGDGSRERYLKELVLKLGLKNYIKFLGKKNVDETIKYYINSDIFILTSTWEGFPLTLLEAWAARLPVITTNVGGISKICIHKKNCLLVPSKDLKKISEAMIILIKNQKLRRELGENGRKLVEEKYNWEKITKKINKIYKNLISE